MHKKSSIIAGVVIFIILIGIGSDYVVVDQTMKRAKKSLESGYPAVAADKLSSIRHSLVKKDAGCVLLINAYFSSRKIDLLEWASQACLEAGREVPEVYLGLATTHELSGRDREALQVLQLAKQKFEKNADIPLRIAKIFRRGQLRDAAIKSYVQAAELAPESQLLSLEALGYFIESKANNEANQMAQRLKKANTDNPEIKLIIARGLKMGGDEAGSKTLVQEAITMVGNNAELKKQLQKTYSDLF